MKKALTALLACATLGLNLSAQDEAAGYLRFNTAPTEDTVDWDDPARFLDVPFVAQVTYRGMVGSASGSLITVADSPIWTPGAFASTHYVEIVNGTDAGMRFAITGNSANSLTVNLGGSSLVDIAATDEIFVAPFWTLNSLFPEGINLTATTEILFASDFTTTFIYRSDLGRWVDSTDTSTDVGDNTIPLDAQLVIRQNAATPIKPFIWGFKAPTPPLRATINYLQIGNNDFANGINLTNAASGALGIDTTGADGETSEPQHGGNTPTTSVWFNYTATQDGSLIINSEKSAFDTILAAYSGAAVDSLTSLASNDDSATGTWSELTFSVSNGVTYRIALDGKSGATGTAYLSWVFSEVAAATTVEDWAMNEGLSGNALLFSADDDGDKLTLLEEYAFNLDPTVGNIAILTAGTGTSGLPRVELKVERLQIEYVRRRNDSNLTYTAEFSSSLLGPYIAGTGTQTVTVISSEFERVVINDSVTSATESIRFGRVSVTESSAP